MGAHSIHSFARAVFILLLSRKRIEKKAQYTSEDILLHFGVCWVWCSWWYAAWWVQMKIYFDHTPKRVWGICFPPIWLTQIFFSFSIFFFEKWFFFVVMCVCHLFGMPKHTFPFSQNISCCWIFCFCFCHWIVREVITIVVVFYCCLCFPPSSLLLLQLLLLLLLFLPLLLLLLIHFFHFAVHSAYARRHSFIFVGELIATKMKNIKWLDLWRRESEDS